MPQFYGFFFSVLAQHSWETSIWFPWLHVGTNYCQFFPANLCYYWRIWYLSIQVKVCYRGKLSFDCKYSSSWPWNSLTYRYIFFNNLHNKLCLFNYTLSWFIFTSDVNLGCKPWSVQIKDYNVVICCFSAKHAALRSKSMDWLRLWYRFDLLCLTPLSATCVYHGDQF